MTATREHTDSLAARRQAQAQARRMSSWLDFALILQPASLALALTLSCPP